MTTAATAAGATSVTAQIAQGYRAHVNRGLGVLLGGYAEVSALGCHVRDHEGNEYLDLGGYGVFLLGHRHPAVVRAVRAQLDTLPLSSRSMASPLLVDAAGRLAGVAPDGLDYVFFGSTGSEAAEMAIKLARLGGRDRIVAMEGGYHGMTLGALSLTSNERYRELFAPLLGGVDHVPFGQLEPLAALLERHPGRCAVVLEPLQGEGGVNIAPDGYLRGVEALCREHGAWLVLDEIQTGLGRTGSWWLSARERVRPDVLLVGKALSGGVVPVSAVIGSAEAWEPLNRDPLLHRSTFSNSPLQLAAVIAALDVLERSDLIARARVLGTRLHALLEETLTARCPGVVLDVRGVGLLLGIELASESLAAALMMELFGEGVLATLCTSRPSVLRLTPPALMSDRDVEWLVSAMDRAAARIAGYLPNGSA